MTENETNVRKRNEISIKLWEVYSYVKKNINFDLFCWLRISAIYRLKMLIKYQIMVFRHVIKNRATIKVIKKLFYEIFLVRKVIISLNW